MILILQRLYKELFGHGAKQARIARVVRFYEGGNREEILQRAAARQRKKLSSRYSAMCGRNAHQSGGAKETGQIFTGGLSPPDPAPATMLNGTGFYRFGVVCRMVYQGV